MTDLAARLLTWYAKRRRDLPWRATGDPYHVLVSEFMLQQTQMDRATAYFRRFTARFPDAFSLAAADGDEVRRHWEGLGYYTRAGNLHQAAKRIATEHGGRVPDTVEALSALPGVGPYTASAVASIAFGRDTPVVDANVIRVLSRHADIDLPVRSREGQARVRRTALCNLPPGRAGDYNQALMELGGLICRPRAPKCDRCPISSDCEALRLDIVAERPVTTPGKAITPLFVATGVLFHRGLVFVQKRLPEGAWAGLWEFPGGRIEPGETPEEAVIREYREETGFSVAVTAPLGIIRHGYTTYRVTLSCFLLALSPEPATPPVPALTAAVASRFVAPDELDRLAFPAGHRKLIDAMKRDLRILKI